MSSTITGPGSWLRGCRGSSNTPVSCLWEECINIYLNPRFNDVACSARKSLTLNTGALSGCTVPGWHVYMNRKQGHRDERGYGRKSQNMSTCTPLTRLLQNCVCMHKSVITFHIHPSSLYLKQDWLYFKWIIDEPVDLHIMLRGYFLLAKAFVPTAQQEVSMWFFFAAIDKPH